MGALSGPRHGRSRETYPSPPPSAGGSGSSNKPLTRQRYIDPLTTTPSGSQTGAEGAPYGSIPIFLASGSAADPGPGIPPVSDDDANTMFVGVLSPAPTDAPGMYAPTLTVPAYRNTGITSQADTISIYQVQGTTIDEATIVWNNVSPDAPNPYPFAPIAASFMLRNIQFLEPSITITDDDTVPSILALLGSGEDESYTASLLEVASFDASAATLFELFLVQGAFCDIEGYAAPTPLLVVSNSLLEIAGNDLIEPNFGAVFARNCEDVDLDEITTGDNFYFQSCFDVDLDVTFTVASPAQATFLGCVVLGSITPAASSGFVFDAVSWRSWMEYTGTSGPQGAFTAPTTVLVIGGFGGGYGASQSPDGDITDSNVPSGSPPTISLALNGSGATAPWTHGGNWYLVDSATDGLVINLLPGGAEQGDTLCITYYNTSNSSGSVVVQDASTGFLGPADAPSLVCEINNAGFIVAEWAGPTMDYPNGQWVLQEVGQLPEST